MAIGELFRKWNLIIEKLNGDLFKESKEDVERYYDERRERRGFLLGKLFELLVILVVTVIGGVFLSLISPYF